MTNPSHTFSNPNLVLECTTDEKTLVARMPSGREKTLVSAEVNEVTGMVELFAGGKVVGGTPSNRLYVVGDSRAQLTTRMPKNATLNQSLGRAVGIGSIDYQSTNTGSLTYDPVMGFRWAASGDTPGGWVPARIGYMEMDSGSGGRRVLIALPTLAGLPASQTSVDLSVFGESWIGYRGEGVAAWANRNLGHSLQIINLGVGGCRADDAASGLAEWWASQINGGYTVCFLGANDVSAFTVPDTALIIENLRLTYDALLSAGTKLAIVGETARYVDYPALTPLGNARRAAVIAINKFQRDYAAARPGVCVHVDVLGLSADQSSSALAPKPRFLRDHVHYSVEGAQKTGRLVAAALQSLGAPTRNKTFGGAGDTDCWMSFGALSGAGGTLSTAATGVAANGLTIGRAAGTNATIAGSVVAGTDGLGDWQQAICAAADTGILQIRTTMVETLAALGLAVGDSVSFAADVSVEDSVGLRSVQFFAFIAGVNHYVHASTPPESPGYFSSDHAQIRMETQIYTIPAGAAGIALYVYIDLDAGGSATVRVRNLERQKHS